MNIFCKLHIQFYAKYIHKSKLLLSNPECDCLEKAATPETVFLPSTSSIAPMLDDSGGLLAIKLSLGGVPQIVLQRFKQRIQISAADSLGIF